MQQQGGPREGICPPPQAGAYCWRQKRRLETSLGFMIARFANLGDLDEISQ